MFGGPPPQASAEEIRVDEENATWFVQRVIVGSVLLYFSPHVISLAKSLVS